MSEVPSHANVIIIGGGIVGCSTAFHLARAGVSDVLLLERDKLTSGTTWHAAGLVAQLRASLNMTRLAKYTVNLFEELETITGQATGYRSTGSISLALNDERMAELSRQATLARAFDVACDVVTPDFIREHWPELNLDDAVGGVYLDGDGQTNPVDTTTALARGARDAGAMILEGTPIERLLIDDDQITGVVTRDGQEIRANKVVLAAGMWSRDLARKHNISVPLQAAEHFYVVTESIDALSSMRPTLRVPDEQAYYKVDAGRLLLGAFELNAKPWATDGVPPDFSFGTLPEDYDHLAEVLMLASDRYPPFNDAGIQLFFNGPESFTPDDRYLLGETPEVAGLFVACGFNSIGIQSSGGAGKVLADWIINGYPPMDLWDVDIRRTFPFQSGRDYLTDRTRETLGLLYAMHWPNRQFETARNVRLSPLHDAMVEKGAVLGELAGWERPNWFATDTEKEYRYTWDKPNWFDASAAESHAVRDDVALFDGASYPIFFVDGLDACAGLNRISTNNIDVEPGQVVYTQWLNERGGIEADVTITRVTATSFMVVSSCALERRDFHYLRQALKGTDVQMVNASDDWMMLAVMGPNSRALLNGAFDGALENLEYYRSTSFEAGGVTIRANRLSYVGELGFELYASRADMPVVYEQILNARPDITHAGFHTLNACRTEKGFRHWGHDIHDNINPIAAGLGFAVDWETPFVGREALSALRDDKTHRLVNFTIEADDTAPFLVHDEPVYRNGEQVGLTTSAAWGHRIGKQVGIAAITLAEDITPKLLRESAFEVEVEGQRLPLTMSLRPFYDPKGERMRPAS